MAEKNGTNATNATAVQTVVKASPSQRFVEKVCAEFKDNVGEALELTDYQKKLIQGYFIIVDRALKSAEEDRLNRNAKNKDPKYNNDLAVVWQNVNMTDLVLDAAHYARIGLDMMSENMLTPIPYKNKAKGWYDITLMEGYNGVRYIGEKYAIDRPRAVTIEVVYSTDVFRPIKKSVNNRVETYEFEITSPFDRGTIVGGFAYLQFSDETKNELIVMSMKDIEKRKPKYASANFWGGKTTSWEGGKQVETENEGWLDEMVRKTLIREAFSAKHLPRDPQKIDESYQYMKDRAVRYAEIEAQAEVSSNANAVLIDTTPDEIVATLPTEETTVAAQPARPVGNENPAAKPGSAKFVETSEPTPFDELDVPPKPSETIGLGF